MIAGQANMLTIQAVDHDAASNTSRNALTYKNRDEELRRLRCVSVPGTLQAVLPSPCGLKARAWTMMPIIPMVWPRLTAELVTW